MSSTSTTPSPPPSPVYRPLWARRDPSPIRHLPPAPTNRYSQDNEKDYQDALVDEKKFFDLYQHHHIYAHNAVLQLQYQKSVFKTKINTLEIEKKQLEEEKKELQQQLEEVKKELASARRLQPAQQRGSLKRPHEDN